MSISHIRTEIDEIDQKILHLLARRFKYSLQVVDKKKIKGLPVFDPAREKELFLKLRKIAKEINFSPDVAEKIFQEIVHQSRKIQERKIQEEE